MGLSTRFILALASLAVLTLSQAAVVRYTLDVHYFSGSPDGIHKDKILGINGQFPGPTLEATVGDTMEITMINNIQDGQNATLHWHGLHMKNQIFQDGTNMITQCPLPQGRTMVYRFNVTQSGTYWYHSHVSSQYTEGMYGPLIIHPNAPEAYDYDGEFTLMLGDWYHQTAEENEAWHVSPISVGMPPYPNSALINGMGRFRCDYAERMNRTCDPDLQLRQVIKVQKDKTYRVRIVNAGSVAGFNFSIEQHQLNTIEADGIDAAHPVLADIVSIAPGQRYSFLVKCQDTGRNESRRYVIRSTLRTENLDLLEGIININPYPEALLADTTAILECVDEDMSHARNLVEMTTEKFTYEDTLPPYMGGRMFLDEMALSPMDGVPAPDYFDREFTVNVVFKQDHEDIRRGSFNYTPLTLPSDKPLLMKLIDGDEIPETANGLEIKYGSVVQLVINNAFLKPHPFHLHGHHFWVMGMGKWNDGWYDSSKHNLTVNGVRRDTLLVEERSWTVIRFVANNPGVWIFHCHIDWHVLTGMGLTFIEGADVLRNTTVVSDEALRVCRMHEENRSFNQFNKISHSLNHHVRH